MHNFYPKCPNTQKCPDTLPLIAYYRRTLQQNVLTPPYCILPTNIFITLQ